MSKSCVVFKHNNEVLDVLFDYSDDSIKISVGDEHYKDTIKLNFELKLKFIESLIRFDLDTVGIAKQLISNHAQDKTILKQV